LGLIGDITRLALWLLVLLVLVAHIIIQRHNNPTFFQYGERWARSEGHVYVDQDISDLFKEVVWRKRNIVPTARSQKQCGNKY
jgi:hypothetical protein